LRAEQQLFVARNEINATCKRCGRIHDYMTRGCVVIAMTPPEWERFPKLGALHMLPYGMPSTDPSSWDALHDA
jgi:hypothetical protein